MLNIGDKAHYLGEIPGATLTGKHTYWNDAVVMDLSACGKFVRIRARPSWGRKLHSFWCKRIYVEDKF